MDWTPLVLFTILSELAVGLVLIYALVGSRHEQLGRPVFLTSWVLTGAAVITSLFHLGWPFSAYRVLGGLGSSWLSWEVVLTGIFGVGTLAAWLRSLSKPIPQVLTAVLSLVGIVATMCSGMIYALPAIPANANLFPPVLFLATALVTGGALLLALLALTKAGREAAGDLALRVTLVTLGALVLTAAVNVLYPAAAASGVPEARQQAAAFTAGVWYVLRLLVGVLVPAGVLVLMARRPKLRILAPALTVALVVVAGELAGRFLFFHSTVFLTFGQ